MNLELLESLKLYNVNFISIINDKKSTSCHLLYMIYLNLYLYLGYNEYHDKAFHYFIKK